MAERHTATKSTRTTTTRSKTPPAFTDEERAAMKERSRELKASARRGSRAAAEDGAHRNKARLDDGTMWPVGYALTELSAANEERIAALVNRAAG